MNHKYAASYVVDLSRLPFIRPDAYSVQTESIIMYRSGLNCVLVYDNTGYILDPGFFNSTLEHLAPLNMTETEKYLYDLVNDGNLKFVPIEHKRRDGNLDKRFKANQV